MTEELSYKQVQYIEYKNNSNKMHIKCEVTWVTPFLKQ